jgi:hypothetical protein
VAAFVSQRVADVVKKSGDLELWIIGEVLFQ